MHNIIQGNFDGVLHNCFVGWVLDPQHYPADVMAVIDGECAGIALAQDHRGDVEAAGIGDGCYGFNIAIPDHFLTGGRHRLDLWVSSAGHRLGESFCLHSGHDPYVSPWPADEPAALVDEKSVLIPHMDGALPAFLRSARSPSEIAIYNKAMSQLNELRALYPSTPYYDRLRIAALGTDRLDAFIQIAETLRHVDQARRGQLPKTGPLVSIIMPVHNRQHLVVDAIGSVLAQSYGKWQLIVCDDASSDDTVATVARFDDPRITIMRSATRSGAAAARNRALQHADGELVAYLDSDNVWHPRYIELMVEELGRWPGHQAAYAGYFDLQIGENKVEIRNAALRRFDLESQIAVPFVDLNSFMHRRTLRDIFGGFDERLKRRQDYDLIARYCWSREPRALPYVLNLYQRIAGAEQITQTQGGDTTSPAMIANKIAGFYRSGVPAILPGWIGKVSVLSWDRSRNHFAKAWCVAEALARHVQVELISYRFFEDEVFQPLADRQATFECKYLDGGEFPDFFANFDKGVEAITGDVIYAIKPRLTSFGLGLMANHRTGKPLMIECNDLETVVAQAKASDTHMHRHLQDLLSVGDVAKNPYDLLWSEILDPLVSEIPTIFTHNINLDLHYDRRCLTLRNIKDETIYRPDTHDRDAIRREMGFLPEDRVILFGGLVRSHKGVFELVDMLKSLDDPRYKLLIVGSRETPDLTTLRQTQPGNIVILPPQPSDRMAPINLAADIVILWQDPAVPAGQYQSPYKMSDAFAMGPTVIASPTSDLAEFAQRGLVLNVPYGDRAALRLAIRRVFDQPEETARRRVRARRFFEREFAYPAVFSSFALGAATLDPNRVYPVAERFAQHFNAFRDRMLE